MVPIHPAIPIYVPEEEPLPARPEQQPVIVPAEPEEEPVFVPAEPEEEPVEEPALVP